MSHTDGEALAPGSAGDGVDGEVVEAVDSLVRSATRVGILAALRESGPLERDDLRERFDVSRTTLQRNLATLEERGWIRREGVQYAPTPCGRLATDGLLDLLETVRVARRLAPALRRLSAEEFDLDPRHLADADVTLSEAGDPYAPVDRLVESLEAATRVRALLPTVGLKAVEVAHRRPAGEEWELVFEETVVEALESPGSAGEFEALVADDRLTAFAHEGSLPFYLGIVDDRVQVGVDDGDGIPRALVETEAGPVRGWAERTYAEYRDRARPL